MGPVGSPVVPPALIADIAGGTYPAVVNILLALVARARTGRGAHLDISMTDNLFALMWWALGQQAATGSAPGNGDNMLTGGSARYRLYPTQDGKVLAAAPIEDRFWRVFCDVIGLEAELRDDHTDPDSTVRAVSAIIAAYPGAHWRQAFDGVDACACLVAGLDEALTDRHFQERGLFRSLTQIPDGQTMPALPVPIVPEFRVDLADRAPHLGEHEGHTSVDGSPGDGAPTIEPGS